MAIRLAQFARAKQVLLQRLKLFERCCKIALRLLFRLLLHLGHLFLGQFAEMRNILIHFLLDCAQFALDLVRQLLGLVRQLGQEALEDAVGFRNVRRRIARRLGAEIVGIIEHDAPRFECLVGPGFPAWPQRPSVARPGWKAWPHVPVCYLIRNWPGSTDRSLRCRADDQSQSSGVLTKPDFHRILFDICKIRSSSSSPRTTWSHDSSCQNAAR